MYIFDEDKTDRIIEMLEDGQFKLMKDSSIDYNSSYIRFYLTCGNIEFRCDGNHNVVERIRFWRKRKFWFAKYYAYHINKELKVPELLQAAIGSAIEYGKKRKIQEFEEKVNKAVSNIEF